jgi:DNA-binding MarR family transcriptional regulator
LNTSGSSALYPVFSMLTRLETELWDALDERLRQECGVPLGRCEAMLIMESQGACRVFDIAKALSITVGGASKLVDRIEAAGYCRRKANPEDRRSSLLELTPQGTALAQTARVVLNAELALRFSPALNDEEIETLTDLLTRLRRAGAPLTTQAVAP